MNTTKISMVSTILMTPQFLIMPKKQKKNSNLFPSCKFRGHVD